MSDLHLDHPLWSHRIIPLATISDVDAIGAIGDGLLRGGLPVVEVALRGDHGLHAVDRLSRRGDVLVGAGTVLNVPQARAAIDAGARFVVTPGLDADVVRFVRDAGIPVIPGVLTPTEIQAARELGLRRVKLFPAGVFGGLALLSTLADVFRDMTFMPSGGVTPETLGSYLAHPAVFAASGSWITRPAPDVEAIAVAARAARGQHD
jgi:2-dehydro-3-deoxyphosphogluconate aldolase/(4S)-4-hydroxy-2-oxoglutarate aldolase